MGWTSTRSSEVCEVPVRRVEQSHRRDAKSIGKKRTTQRLSERMEKAAHGVLTSDQCDCARFHEDVAGGSRQAKTTADVSSAIQMLEKLVRKYEEHSDKLGDNDLELQTLHDFLPKPITQQLVLEERDGTATSSL